MQSGNQSTALVEFFNYRLGSDDGNGDIIVGYQYEYDNGGNITDIKAEVDGALIPLEHYEYEEKQGQLETAIRYENGEEVDRWTYSYDTAGNILSEDHEGSNSELHEYAYEDGRWGDLLTSVDGIDLEYDGSGNPTFYANGTELLWSMEWQNGRQLSRAATERDSTTEDVLDFAYDANGIRTRKTVTRNTYRPVQTYKVTFVADGKTVKTMNVTEGYTLKDSDYPAVPEKAGYTGAWQRYPSPVQSNVTVSVTYTKITTYYTVTFVADGETVKTISVYSGYKLTDSDYPRVPYKVGYEGSWQKRTAPVTSNVTINAVYTQILHTVSFRVMDEGIIYTMEVPDRYVLQEEDYPTIPKRVGYTSRWDTRVTMIVRDTIIDAIYSDGSTHEVTFLAYGNENLGTITVEDGYLLQEEDYPTIPERTGYRGSWPTQVDPIYEDTIIHAQYEEAIPVPTLPTSPGEIMSGGEGEPVEADEPEEGENDTTPAETEHTISGVLASTETVTHEYLTQSGKVVRETITTSMDTTTLDFFYDESGRPFAFNYTPEGSTPNTYYYILNLQGDVVQIIDEGGVMQAEYVYSPWGEVISAEGDLAEINPLRYRGYYYDSETGFYYLQSRYYDPTNRRFINADSYASTGQGFLGVNMFAYCNNLPVILHDSNGEFPSLLIVIPIVIIAGLLGGCESEMEKKWPKEGHYKYKPRGSSSMDDNCYSYAFDYNGVCDPGDSSGVSSRLDDAGGEPHYSLGSIKEGVLADAAVRGKNVKYLPNEYINYKIPDGAYLIACKISSDATDYHFAVMLSDGIWIDKPGIGETRYGAIDGFANTWTIGDITYAGDTMYFLYTP